MRVEVYKLFYSAFRLLEVLDRRKFWFLSSVQVLLAVVDLAAVAILGAVGALSVRSIQSQESGFLVNLMLEFFSIQNKDLQTQVAILAGVAVFLLVSRTVLTLFFTRKTLRFLSTISAKLSASLAKKILNLPLVRLSTFNVVELQYALGPGMSAIVLGVLGAGSSILADLSLLIILSLGVLMVNPTVAVSSLILFISTGFLLYINMHKRAKRNGEELTRSSIDLNNKIRQTIESYRDLFVLNLRYKQGQDIEKLKTETASLYADQTLMPYLSKYVVEIMLIFGAMTIAALLFITEDISRAVAGLFLFIAVGSRIAPALLRLQQSALSVQINSGMANSTLKVLRNLESDFIGKASINLQDFEHKSFLPEVTVSSVDFRYSPTSELVLKDISFNVNVGEFTAVVGSSGSGKSTLVDLILGLHTPEKGSIQISNLPPEDAIKQWPGAIGYVPQEVVLFSGSIRDNIALSVDSELQNLVAIQKAIALAQLDDFINSLCDGLDTQIGEKGTRLSGGQKQRLGIARAMYTNPKLLILDEATSSLDSLTESEVSAAIQNLMGSVTVIVVAHRLSTIQEADNIIYLESGSMVAQGPFEELRNLVKNFDEQARLMGL
jgi:ABC-type multidrug transport system fused ATPase/permease subunit